MSEATTEQAVTETTPVVEDDKPKTVPYERLSEMAAQKNAALADAKVAREELEKINTDRDKVRKAQLEKQGEFKILHEENVAKVESLTKERDEAVKHWSDHLAKRGDALKSKMDEAKVDDETKGIAMKIVDLDDRETFINRITNETISTSTDGRRAANQIANGKLKPLTEMTDQEKRDTHQARMDQYRT